MNGALAAVRALHFAATLSLEGAIVFRVAALAPAFDRARQSVPAGLRSFLASMTAASWIVAVLSAAGWLFVLGGVIAGVSPVAALQRGTDWILLTQTKIGMVWQASGGLALMLAFVWLSSRSPRGLIWKNLLAVLLVLAFAGSLTWAGHGAATPGAVGDFHLAADILHLVAAGIWLGGLLPFATLMGWARGDAKRILAARNAAERFSLLALVCVLHLLGSGIVNSWVLVGNVSGLTGTLYGRLLLAKIGLFLSMLGFAAVNRLHLMPRLKDGTSAARAAARRLALHSVCEVILGLAVLGIVGVLGMLPPPAH